MQLIDLVLEVKQVMVLIDGLYIKERVIPTDTAAANDRKVNGH